jgi:ketosteroid isomerase-like protein
MSAPEEHVLAALEALDRACGERDADAIVSLFVDDPDVTFWGSAQEEHAVGPGELRELANAIAASRGTFSVDWRERRACVRGDVAWINAAGTAHWADGAGASLEMPYRMTGVLLRRAGAWKWHTFHGSEPQTD